MATILKAGSRTAVIPSTRSRRPNPVVASSHVSQVSTCRSSVPKGAMVPSTFASSFMGRQVTYVPLSRSTPMKFVPKARGKVVIKAMFERFTEKAIKVVMLAQEEARRLGHNFVGTEQLLLGLIGESTGIAAKVLKSMGVNLKDARVEVEKIIGRGSGFVAVEIPFTPRAKRVLELSLEEARQLGT